MNKKVYIVTLVDKDDLDHIKGVHASIKGAAVCAKAILDNKIAHEHYPEKAAQESKDEIDEYLEDLILEGYLIIDLFTDETIVISEHELGD